MTDDGHLSAQLDRADRWMAPMVAPLGAGVFLLLLSEILVLAGVMAQHGSAERVFLVAALSLCALALPPAGVVVFLLGARRPRG